MICPLLDGLSFQFIEDTGEGDQVRCPRDLHRIETGDISRNRWFDRDPAPFWHEAVTQGEERFNLLFRALDGEDIRGCAIDPRQEIRNREGDNPRPGADIEDRHLLFQETVTREHGEEVFRLHEVDREVVRKVAQHAVAFCVVQLPFLRRLPVIAFLGSNGLPEPVTDNRVAPVLPGFPGDVLFHSLFEHRR